MHPSSPIETVIRTSKRAQRILLRVMPYPLRAELIIPHGSSHSKALAFLASKHAWIEKRAGMFPSHIPLQPDTLIPVLGQEAMIRHTGNLRGVTRLEGGIVSVSGFPEHCETRVKRFLHAMLLQEISRKAQEYAAALGCNYRKITLRETTSRWGSCSSNGNLSFSWKLVFAPLAVLHYVIAHEVAHLKELNHSPAFWKEVNLLCPEALKHRAWLKQYGMGLHRYGKNHKA